MAVRGLSAAFLLSSLSLTLTRFGEACVSNSIVVNVQGGDIKAEEVISKVDLEHCQKDTLQISTSDADFAVRLDGSLYATRNLHIPPGQRTFVVRLRDPVTLMEWKIDVTLVQLNIWQLQLREKRHARNRRATILRRQKRRWRPRPFEITENFIGPFPHYVQTIRSDLQQNFTLSYRISGQGVDLPPLNLFSIKPDTGEIFVLRTVDREEYPLFKLTGIARTPEGFYPEQPLDLTVKVIDVNDNAPEFVEKVFSSKVAERSAAGTTVLILTATDRDEAKSLNTMLKYKILSQMPVSKFGLLFSVDDRTGEIRTNNDKLDREDQDAYTLRVEVRDMNGANYGLFSTASVVVHVTDVNDHTPTFKSSKYTVAVNETESDIMILRIPVDDKDLANTSASRAVFTIVEGNENGNFKMLTDPKTNDGLLYVVKPLDAEAAASIPLEIAVENEEPLIGSTAARQIASVIVNVADIDEGPEFEPAIKHIRTKENVAIGTVLGSYVARDPEANSSKGIRYKKLFDPADWVSIDQKTGVIKTAGVMDRESEFVNNNRYNVTVLAIEDRVPPRTGTGTVVIILDDINDNDPIIHNKDIHFCENGFQKFVNVSAEDLDATPYAAPFTFLLPNNPPEVKEKWVISKQMGSYAHVKPVVLLPPGYYEVPIIVQDQQNRGTQQTLKILICECPNNLNCANRLASRSAVLGGLGILVMLLAALLLLCLLLAAIAFYCGGDQKKIAQLFPDNQYHQSLIVSNEEGGGQQDKILAALDIPLSQKENFRKQGSQQYSNQETVFGSGNYPIASQVDGVKGMNSGTMVMSEMVNVKQGMRQDQGGVMYDRGGSMYAHQKSTLCSQGAVANANMTMEEANSLHRRNSLGLMNLLRSRVELVYEEEEMGANVVPTDYVRTYQYQGDESITGSAVM